MKEKKKKKKKIKNKKEAIILEDNILELFIGSLDILMSILLIL